MPQTPIRLERMVNQILGDYRRNDLLHHPHEADGVGRRLRHPALARHRTLHPGEPDGGGWHDHQPLIDFREERE